MVCCVFRSILLVLRSCNTFLTLQPSDMLIPRIYSNTCPAVDPVPLCTLYHYLSYGFKMWYQLLRHSSRSDVILLLQSLIFSSAKWKNWIWSHYFLTSLFINVFPVEQFQVMCKSLSFNWWKIIVVLNREFNELVCLRGNGASSVDWGKYSDGRELLGNIWSYS